MEGAVPLFDRYVGIDYSGAKRATDSLSGLRVYRANREAAPVEIQPPPGRRKYWSRKGIAEWLVEELGKPNATLVGIDHGFSFPVRYFDERPSLSDWPTFLEDFHARWPTDEDQVTVKSVRDGLPNRGVALKRQTRWRRAAEERVRAKSVFHFDVPGSVASSTHAGLPWLLRIRKELGDRVHFWPFDGWIPPAGKSVLAEVYPSLWSSSYPRWNRTPDQHDAYSAAAWMQEADRDGRLAAFLEPELPDVDEKRSHLEGWILGVR